MAYEVVMSYHLHMPSYFLGTFTEYPDLLYLKIPLIDNLLTNLLYNAEFVLIPIASSMGVKV